MPGARGPGAGRAAGLMRPAGQAVRAWPNSTRARTPVWPAGSQSSAPTLEPGVNVTGVYFQPFVMAMLG
jgi:hypothetical protein